ncbi:hypothetical protein CRM22_002742 [Opisthorchis felineus]|uniref:ADP-ribosylation factor-like protein 13B n=1 Tax=Opisthorchis felineus TaxID=147828 RepID=A0A4S2MAM9_OPIFE|nr:hypothetical protein CRM22_002742 [Opisthorchis felineus]
MNSCFQFIRCKKKNIKEIYLVILGLDNAGKTTTTRSIKGISSDLVAPTVGFDRIEFSNGKFHVNLYDLGGGRTIRDIWKTYFAEVHGIIFVVDSSDTERLNECRTVLSKLLAHSSVSGKPVLLLANKKDVAEALDEPELIEALKLDQLVNQFRCPCRLERCCALLTKHKKMDKAIRMGLRWLLAYIESQLPVLEKRIRLDTEKQAREQALEREARRERVRLARERRERLDMQQDSNGVQTSVDCVSDRTYSVTSSKHSDHTGKMGDVRMEESGTPARRLTVIDLESKINRRDNSEGHRDSARSMSSLPPMFNQTPQPVVNRDLKLLPPQSTKSTKQDTASLLHSSEAKRQIDPAGKLDNNSLNKVNTESMQIEELDNLEVGDLSTGDTEQIPSTYLRKLAKENHYKPERASAENGYQLKSQKPTPRGSLASESKQSPLCASNVSNPLTPMFRVEEGCGRLPPVVDALYTSQSKDYSSATTSAETRPSDPYPFSSYLTLASSTKRPSPFARIFTPSINKLHPHDPGQRTGK